MNKKSFITVVGIVALLVVSMTVHFAKAKNVHGRAVSILLTNNNSLSDTTKKIQQCPDSWIDNQMPFVGKEKPVTEYYILNGERRDIDVFDGEWIAKNCTLTKQVVY